MPIDVVNRSNGTLETFAVRTMAQLMALSSMTAGSFQAAFGVDNSAMLARYEDAQLILRHTGFNTTDGGILAQNLASAAQAVDGLVGGVTLIGTNTAGIIARDVALLDVLATGDPLPPLPSPTEFLQLIDSDASLSDKINGIVLDVLKYNPVTLGAEGLYRMGSALVEGNYEALRNESYNMLVLFGSISLMKTRAAKRELQLRVKQVDFLNQQLRRGVIEEAPLRDLVRKAANTRGYVVETGRVGPNGLPVLEGRVLTAEAYARASKGILERTEAGEVVYKACFAAGTLVHTQHGPLPIEQVRVGTRVLSQPEQGGEQDYRTVINTVAHLDQVVYAVQVRVTGADTLTTVIATPNHPFWVESPLADDAHWMAAQSLQPGFVLQLADGRSAIVHASGLVRRTQYPDVGFAADDRAGVGIVLDLRDGRVVLADAGRSLALDTLQLGEPYLTRVYNFEVEVFHTYYVGDAAVWVHNQNCTELVADRQVAIDQAIFRQERIDRLSVEKTCFRFDRL